MIESIGPLQFRVPGNKNPEGYIVDLEARSCTCEDWCFRRRPLKQDCKHIQASIFHLGEQVVEQLKGQRASYGEYRPKPQVTRHERRYEW